MQACCDVCFNSVKQACCDVCFNSIIQACCDVAFEYAHVRETFGQKIGTYQVCIILFIILVG